MPLFILPQNRGGGAKKGFAGEKVEQARGREWFKWHTPASAHAPRHSKTGGRGQEKCFSGEKVEQARGREQFKWHTPASAHAHHHCAPRARDND